MSILSFSMKIVESNSTIAQEIARALLPDVNRYFDRVYDKVKNTIPKLVIDSIKNQPEYSSLISGKLKGEFGLPDASSRIDSILSTIENSVVLQKKSATISGGQIKTGLKLQMIQSNFADLISLSDATFVTEKGSSLNWLRWLLIEGDNIIIADHEFLAGPYSSSRTGMGIMNEFKGAFWRVPPEYAGNINNNWITRAIAQVSGNIEQELTKAMS